jgi:hypothetical protein
MAGVMSKSTKEKALEVLESSHLTQVQFVMDQECADPAVLWDCRNKMVSAVASRSGGRYRGEARTMQKTVQAKLADMKCFSLGWYNKSTNGVLYDYLLKKAEIRKEENT